MDSSVHEVPVPAFRVYFAYLDRDQSKLTHDFVLVHARTAQEAKKVAIDFLDHWDPHTEWEYVTPGHVVQTNSEEIGETQKYIRQIVGGWLGNEVTNG